MLLINSTRKWDEGRKERRERRGEKVMREEVRSLVIIFFYSRYLTKVKSRDGAKTADSETAGSGQRVTGDW